MPRSQCTATVSFKSGGVSMVELSDAAFQAAADRGDEMMEREPRAASASYDRETGRVVVELANDCTFIFPAHLAGELQGADDEALSDVRVDGAGFNLHWPAIDADLNVPALVAGVFGTRTWMAREWARMAGGSRTPVKAAASRKNGAKGGRPRSRKTA